MVDFAALPPHLRPQAVAVVAERSFLHADDAPLFSFVVTRSGAISRSRKDLRLSDAALAAGVSLGRS